MALVDIGQAVVFVVVLGGIVAAFGVELEVAVEGDHGARCAQADATVRSVDIEAHLVEHSRRHLASHGAVPNQLVEPRLIAGQAHLVGNARRIGRADCLMCLLGVLRARLVAPRLLRQIIFAV